MSTIYGFYAGGHDASTTLIVDGKIEYCIEEERLDRIKSGLKFESYPILSSKKVEDLSGIKIMDSDYIVFSDPTPPKYARELSKNKYETVSHHTSHNYASYFTSGMDGKVISISYDGGGESSFMKVFLCENGKMVETHNLSRKNSASIAQLWGFVTTYIMGRDENCQFKWVSLKDEGKLMGMAPNGVYNQRIQTLLSSVLSYKDLNFFPSGTDQKTKFLMEVLLDKGFFETQEQKEMFAYNLQYFTEKHMINFINDLHKKHPGYNKLCLSGGLFANVKLNQKINNLDWVEEIYVLPPMGDQGLSLGCAIYKAVEIGDIKKPFRLDNVFFGTQYSNEDVSNFEKDFDFKKTPYNVDEISNDLINGKILGWFQGRMEFGPRSLGSRSILVKPTDTDTHNILNERLGRYETMPFAPMVLEEYFDDIFLKTKSKYTAEFMTLTYQTKDTWTIKIPAVIQKTDGTARPQIVTRSNNLMIWELINYYHLKSEIPVLLNTSFNAHNEPIIENPYQAFTHLKNKVIDKLVINEYVYESW